MVPRTLGETHAEITVSCRGGTDRVPATALRLFADNKSYAFLANYPPIDALGARVIGGPTIDRAPRMATAAGS
jgi:hypothetical protein